jgi:hypothetical protein
MTHKHKNEYNDSSKHPRPPKTQLQQHNQTIKQPNKMPVTTRSKSICPLKAKATPVATSKAKASKPAAKATKAKATAKPTPPLSYIPRYGYCYLFCGTHLRPYTEDELWVAHVSDIYLDPEGGGVWEVEPVSESEARVKAALEKEGIESSDFVFGKAGEDGMRTCQFRCNTPRKMEMNIEILFIDAQLSVQPESESSYLAHVDRFYDNKIEVCLYADKPQ